MSSKGALFELEDQTWFPELLRRMQTEYIGWLAMSFKVYRPLAPVLADALERIGKRSVVDLASGNGGPIKDLARAPELKEIEFLLTDKFPSPDATGNERISWHTGPIDALSEVSGEMRTMFNAFHHFNGSEKRALIANHGPHGLLVAELLRPGVICFLQILFVTTIGQVILCPFVRPFRWERLLFTWLIPINLITVMWDGLVSVLRVDPQHKLEAIARSSAPGGAQVKSGICGKWWARVAWFIVIPGRS